MKTLTVMMLEFSAVMLLLVWLKPMSCVAVNPVDTNFRSKHVASYNKTYEQKNRNLLDSNSDSHRRYRPLPPGPYLETCKPYEGGARTDDWFPESEGTQYSFDMVCNTTVNCHPFPICPFDQVRSSISFSNMEPWQDMNLRNQCGTLSDFSQSIYEFTLYCCGGSVHFDPVGNWSKSHLSAYCKMNPEEDAQLYFLEGGFRPQSLIFFVDNPPRFVVSNF